jgi:hypothetical protein
LPSTLKCDQGKQTNVYGKWNSFLNNELVKQIPGNEKPKGEDQRNVFEKLIDMF